jgi:hypothetical protein
MKVNPFTYDTTPRPLNVMTPRVHRVHHVQSWTPTPTTGAREHRDRGPGPHSCQGGATASMTTDAALHADGLPGTALLQAGAAMAPHRTGR